MNSTDESLVYVIGIMDLDREGPIEKERVKIGKAEDIDKRTKTFQTASPHPIAIIATYPGAEDLEYALHSWFQSRRIGLQLDTGRHRGEWFNFKDTDPLPLINHAVHVIRSRHLEWISAPDREKANQKAARSTNLATKRIHSLGDELQRLLNMGTRTQAEADLVLALGFSPQTKADEELRELAFTEHVYLINLLAERVETCAEDLRATLRAARQAGVLDQDDAKAATDRTADITNSSSDPLTLIEEWRNWTPPGLTDFMDWLARPPQ